MYMCVCVFVRVSIVECVLAHTHVCMHACMHVFGCIFMREGTSACVCVYARLCAPRYVCFHTCFSHSHTQTRSCSCLSDEYAVECT